MNEKSLRENNLLLREKQVLFIISAVSVRVADKTWRKSYILQDKKTTSCWRYARELKCDKSWSKRRKTREKEKRDRSSFVKCVKPKLVTVSV